VVGLALAPGVQGVVDEPAALQQPLIVGFDVQAALTDRQQARAERVAVQLAGRSAAWTMRASLASAGSAPRSKASIRTSKVHLPSRWVNSASGASKERACSISATARTCSAWT
jgi:hypothetical protein